MMFGDEFCGVESSLSMYDESVREEESELVFFSLVFIVDGMNSVFK